MESDPDPDLEIVESVYDALENEDPQRALELARDALAAAEQDDPVLHFLAGVALLELDRPDQAVHAFRHAVRLDPDEAEFRANLSLALFRSLRIEDAAREVRLALDADDTLPDAHLAHGLVQERAGDFQAADRSFARAHTLDPDAFPAPVRMSRDAFENEVRSAAERLPEKFRACLDEVGVTVEPLPADELLSDDDSPIDPELLGLFVGVPITERSVLSPGGELPPRILLFQRNLERCFPDIDVLREEIARTLYHELGHYMGLDEDDLEAIDLA